MLLVMASQSSTRKSSIKSSYSSNHRHHPPGTYIGQRNGNNGDKSLQVLLKEFQENKASKSAQLRTLSKVSLLLSSSTSSKDNYNGSKLTSSGTGHSDNGHTMSYATFIEKMSSILKEQDEFGLDGGGQFEGLEEILEALLKIISGLVTGSDEFKSGIRQSCCESTLQIIRSGIGAISKIRRKGDQGEKVPIHYSTITLGAEIVLTLTRNDSYWQRKLSDERIFTQLLEAFQFLMSKHLSKDYPPTTTQITRCWTMVCFAITNCIDTPANLSNQNFLYQKLTENISKGGEEMTFFNILNNILVSKDRAFEKYLIPVLRILKSILKTNPQLQMEIVRSYNLVSSVEISISNRLVHNRAIGPDFPIFGIEKICEFLTVLLTLGDFNSDFDKNEDDLIDYSGEGSELIDELLRFIGTETNSLQVYTLLSNLIECSIKCAVSFSSSIYKTNFYDVFGASSSASEDILKTSRLIVDVLKSQMKKYDRLLNNIPNTPPRNASSGENSVYDDHSVVEVEQSRARATSSTLPIKRTFSTSFEELSRNSPEIKRLKTEDNLFTPDIDRESTTNSIFLIDDNDNDNESSAGSVSSDLIIEDHESGIIYPIVKIIKYSIKGRKDWRSLNDKLRGAEVDFSKIPWNSLQSTGFENLHEILSNLEPVGIQNTSNYIKVGYRIRKKDGGGLGNGIINWLLQPIRWIFNNI